MLEERLVGESRVLQAEICKAPGRDCCPVRFVVFGLHVPPSKRPRGTAAWADPQHFTLKDIGFGDRKEGAYPNEREGAELTGCVSNSIATALSNALGGPMPPREKARGEREVEVRDE